MRIQSLDLARGFTILVMPSIHVALLYSNPQVKRSMFIYILKLLAEWPGAQVFMVVMGISFRFSSRINGRSVLQRAFYLLATAYLLNVLKFVVPYLLGNMPDAFLQEIKVFPGNAQWLFLLGDILHFAGIAYIICFVLRRRVWLTLIVMVGIIFISPFLWDIHSADPVINYMLQLAGGYPPRVFFPLFPWLVYPLTGLVIGHYLEKVPASVVFRNAAVIGMELWFVGFVYMDNSSFYRTTPAATICHLGFVLMWLAAWHWISSSIRITGFFRLLTYLSKNITFIYIVQWILICWCLSFTGYGLLDMTWTILWMVLVSINSFLFPLLKNYRVYL